MRLMRWRSEVMVAGRNARMRVLLDLPITESKPNARLVPSPPREVEVTYRSPSPPTIFQPGLGMDIPDHVTHWSIDEGIA